MKIKRVLANNRKKTFVIEAQKHRYEFPYSQLRIKPSRRDPLARVAPDPELGNEGFTYQLRSGASDSVHLDHVLRYLQDPEYLREELLYSLTIKAKKLIAKLHISKREVARRLKTSPSQLYRLLDPTYYGKTIDHMIGLLYALGQTVELRIRKEAA